MDAIANYIVQHPYIVEIGHGIGIVLGCLTVVLALAACYFLAFGRQRSFHYRPGSIEGVGWKIGWILVAFDVLDLTYRLSTGSKNAGTIELAVMCFPFVLLLVVQMYGSKYHRVKTEELRQERVAKEK